MTELLLFMAASIGMTLIVTRGEIFSEFRAWVLSFAPKMPENTTTAAVSEDGTPIVLPPPPLTTIQYLRRKITAAINCCQCTGFWCGVFCGIWYVYYGSVADTNHVINVFKLFLCGCVGSVTSMTADIFLEYLVRHR
jgi:hypothetical protein